MDNPNQVFYSLFKLFYFVLLLGNTIIIDWLIDWFEKSLAIFWGSKSASTTVNYHLWLSFLGCFICLFIYHQQENHSIHGQVFDVRKIMIIKSQTLMVWQIWFWWCFFRKFHCSKKMFFFSNKYFIIVARSVVIISCPWWSANYCPFFCSRYFPWNFFF